MIFQDMPANQAREIRAAAAAAPMSDPSLEYPEWYMHRWHFLPEGYLSSRSAAGYDRVIRNVYNAFSEHRVIREVLRRARIFEPQTVLEVGSGPGRLLERLGRIRTVRKVTGVDLSPYLIQRAASRPTAQHRELIHGNGLHLPIADASFDLATASHYMGHIPQSARADAAAELTRVVRPGGHVLIVDHRWHRWPDAPLLRRVEDSFHAFGSIRMSVFERLPGGAPA